MTALAGPTANTPTPVAWRWPLALVLVCGIALLGKLTPLAHTLDGRLDHSLASDGFTWVVATQQELPAPTKRSSSTGHAGGDSQAASPIGLPPTAVLLLVGLLLVALRQYFDFQINLIPSPASTAPCAPRAPPPGKSSRI